MAAPDRFCPGVEVSARPLLALRKHRYQFKEISEIRTAQLLYSDQLIDHAT